MTTTPTPTEIAAWLSYWQNCRTDGPTVEAIRSLDDVATARRFNASMRAGRFAEVTDAAIWDALQALRAGNITVADLNRWADRRAA